MRREKEDRYGDVPPQVEALVTVSLLRNAASACFVRTIRQEGDSLVLYPDDLKNELVASLFDAFPGNVSVNAKGEPKITAKLKKGDDTLSAVKKLTGALVSASTFDI